MSNQFTTSLILTSILWIVVIFMLLLPMFNTESMRPFLLPLIVMISLSLLNVFLVAGA
jgi:preprotein translocase subunit SecF